ALLPPPPRRGRAGVGVKRRRVDCPHSSLAPPTPTPIEWTHLSRPLVPKTTRSPHRCGISWLFAAAGCTPPPPPPKSLIRLCFLKCVHAIAPTLPDPPPSGCSPISAPPMAARSGCRGRGKRALLMCESDS